RANRSNRSLRSRLPDSEPVSVSFRDRGKNPVTFRLRRRRQKNAPFRSGRRQQEPLSRSPGKPQKPSSHNATPRSERNDRGRDRRHELSQYSRTLPGHKSQRRNKAGRSLQTGLA